MLHEIRAIRQNNRSLRRRWYHDHDMDLFVWLREGEPVRFQLSYDHSGDEKMVCWDYHHGVRHYRVDNGERPAGRYKMSPVLVDTDDHFNPEQLARQFLAASENMQASLADFIYARLMACPSQNLHIQGKAGLAASQCRR